MKKKRKLNKKKLLLFVIMLVFFFMFLLSLIKIISYLENNKDNKKIQETIIKDSITIIESIEENQKIKYDIDFKTLKEQNSDTVAYLKVNNTNIDYIVVKGNDNSYYLKHNFKKKWNVSGWIFADYHNKFDDSDKNIIIFGHNTRDGSMFGTLKNSLNEVWYENEDNQKIVLVTEKGIYYYQVFSTYSIKPEDYYINTEFKDNDEFDKFIKKLKSRSIYDYKVEVSGEDKILTLSSCIGDGTKRVVLHAKLIND